MACGCIYLASSSSNPGFINNDYNAEHVSSVSCTKINKGVLLTINFKSSIVTSRYRNLLVMTPNLYGKDPSDEHYLAGCYGAESGTGYCNYSMWLYDTNNGANWIEDCAYSYFLPNREAEY